MTDASSERAAVVAWLRRVADADGRPFLTGFRRLTYRLIDKLFIRSAIHKLASAIERGDHLARRG